MHSFKFFSISALCLVSFLFVTPQSCKKDTLLTFGTTTNPAPNSQKRILTIVNSYTVGELVPELERFPYETISILTASSINLKYPSQIIARTG